MCLETQIPPGGRQECTWQGHWLERNAVAWEVSHSAYAIEELYDPYGQEGGNNVNVVAEEAEVGRKLGLHVELIGIAEEVQ